MEPWKILYRASTSFLQRKSTPRMLNKYKYHIIALSNERNNKSYLHLLRLNVYNTHLSRIVMTFTQFVPASLPQHNTAVAYMCLNLKQLLVTII